MAQRPQQTVEFDIAPMDDSNEFFSLVFDERRRDTFPKSLKRPSLAATLKHCSYSEGHGNWGKCELSFNDIKRETKEAQLMGPAKLKVRRNGLLNRSFCSPKKHVVFADDLGLQLTSVKLFTKPSDELLLSHRVKAQWKAEFCKPYLNFVKFLEKLNQSNVALETFCIETDTETLVGSVKVKNLAYQKSITVRLTDNNWQSYRDFPTVYRADQHSLQYDTFTFEIPLANSWEHVTKVQFCTRYATPNREFWDNNGGANYTLVKEPSKFAFTGGDQCEPVRNPKIAEVPKVRSIRSIHSSSGTLACGILGFKSHFAPNYSAMTNTENNLMCR